jgi:hypothetical protein
MGEAIRMREKGVQFKQLQPGQQIQVDLKNAVPKVCECGGKYFQPVVMLYTVSALVSPTGQELTAQQPVLVCLDCKTPAK